MIKETVFFIARKSSTVLYLAVRYVDIGLPMSIRKVKLLNTFGKTFSKTYVTTAV